MRLLVTGAGGMLGRDVIRAGERAGHELTALPRAELDICDASAVERSIARVGPDALINCAAWTDVDGAESHREEARQINAQGAGNLARASAAAGAALLHVSTDYVFSGEPPRSSDGQPRPYLESDAPDPRSVYGVSKLAGEREVLGASERHCVVRSSWLFGLDGPNFAATMLRLAGERESVQVVTDQIGCPTWTGHLGPALIGLVERELAGLVHLAGGGRVSWNGFAEEIFRQAEIDCPVEPASSEQLARPAPRPGWSVLSSERDEVIPMPDWREGLAGYLAARAGMMRR